MVDSEIVLTQLKSPNEKWALWIKDYNLVLTDVKNHKDFFLTSDGTNYYDYASSPETNTKEVTQRLEGIPSPPIGLWSFDSKKILTHKLDQRNVSELFLLQKAPESSQRPKITPLSYVIFR